MNLSAPQTAVMSRIDGQILRVLAGTTRPLSGREVARLARASPASVWRALQRLVDHGVVSTQEAGSGAALLHTLNRDHVGAEPLVALLRLHESLFGRIGDAVGSWRIRPIHVSIFGSAARGEGSTESDIDVFVVRPRAVDREDEQWRSQLDELAASIHAWSGNHGGLIDVAESELPRMRREQRPIVAALEEDAVVLFGPPIQQVFGH